MVTKVDDGGDDGGASGVGGLQNRQRMDFIGRVLDLANRARQG
jgi:hypothetical protein